MNMKKMSYMGCSMEDNIEYKANEFVIFCIEVFKEENKLTGKEVYELFEKYGVLKYLHDGYDMLHTQGDRWLMNDINEFLKIRGYNAK